MRDVAGGQRAELTVVGTDGHDASDALGLSASAPEAWWTRGWPRNSGPVLLEDLRAEGLI